MSAVDSHSSAPATGLPPSTVSVALLTLSFQLQDPVYRVGVYAAGAWYALGLVYFAAIGRHRLILSPEEEFALNQASK